MNRQSLQFSKTTSVFLCRKRVCCSWYA